MAWNNNGGGYQNNGGGNNYQNGGNNGGGQRGGRVSFAGGTASFNKQPKGERSRHFGGTLKFPNGDARWLSCWINAPRENASPNAQAAIQHILGVIAQEGLFLSIDVGDIAPPRQGQGAPQGQGGGYQQNGGGNYQNNGGGYQQAPQQGGQQNSFQFGGNGNQGGAGFGQGGFQR